MTLQYLAESSGNKQSKLGFSWIEGVLGSVLCGTNSDLIEAFLRWDSPKSIDK